MLAAEIDAHGEVPALRAVDEPQRGAGQALVEVLAAPLNPVDLAIASGRFYGGVPPLPHRPGREGAGRVLAGQQLTRGTIVYFDASTGALAQRAAIDEASAVALPAGADPARAAALGIAGLAAWLALEHHAGLQPGEHVLVLGASGAVGAIAVQAARLLGAGRVAGAARDTDAVPAAADAVVALDDDPAGYAERFRDACAGRLDVVVDPLWGPPAEAAAVAASHGARLVQLGQSAGTEATFLSSTVRGKQLRLLGHSNFAVPATTRRAAYERLLAHAEAGELDVAIETMPLDRVGEAWERQAGSPHAKLVLVP